MPKELDELLAEIDGLKIENQRLQAILDSNIRTMEAMAEGIAMLSHPNWTMVDDKDKIIENIVIEWMTRSGYERDTAKRSK